MKLFKHEHITASKEMNISIIFIEVENDPAIQCGLNLVLPEGI